MCRVLSGSVCHFDVALPWKFTNDDYFVLTLRTCHLTLGLAFWPLCGVRVERHFVPLLPVLPAKIDGEVNKEGEGRLRDTYLKLHASN